MDTDIGTELFAGYENDFNLIIADISSKLQGLQDQDGEPRKAALRAAERAVEEAEEIIGQMEMEVMNIPNAQRPKVSARLRGHKATLEKSKSSLKKASKPTAREALFGSRYSDQDTDLEAQDNQRTRLLSGTERLERSSQRLRDSQRIANETEDIGAGILGDLHLQREQILNTRDTLMEADGYVDKSLRTLKGMARRMQTNKLITGGIITILVVIIVLIVWAKCNSMKRLSDIDARFSTGSYSISSL